MTNFEKAQNEITKALRALNNAAELIENTPEYRDRASVFHAQEVSRYNHIITAALTLNEAQI